MLSGRGVKFTNWTIRRRHYCSFPNLVAGSLEVLQTPDPNKKAKCARRIYNNWFSNKGKMTNHELNPPDLQKQISKFQSQLQIEPKSAENLKFATHFEMGSHKQRKEIINNKLFGNSCNY